MPKRSRSKPAGNARRKRRGPRPGGALSSRKPHRTSRGVPERGVRPRRRATPAGGAVLRARDLMTRTPVTVPTHLQVGALCDLLQEKNINGAPVVDERGRLVGIVTQEDIIYGAMGHPDADGGGVTGAHGDMAETEAPGAGKSGRGSKRVVEMLRRRPLREAPLAAPRSGEKPFWAEDRAPDPMAMPVSAIMTSPAISAEEDTPITDLCRIMWSLRIHRVPILRKGRVTGLVSSMDLCRGVLEGKIRI